MLSKEEYLAGIYKIFGVGFTTPFGALFLMIPMLNVENIDLRFIAYSVITIIMFIIGIIVLLTGYDLAYTRTTGK